MNLHEYQGKEILNSFGVRIQRGIVASTTSTYICHENVVIGDNVKIYPNLTLKEWTIA